jgi:hypothetical protein
MAFGEFVMTRKVIGMTLLVTVAAVWPTRADDPKSRFNLNLSKLNPLNRLRKDDPAAKVKQLTETLRTDPDAGKRKSAADELRDTDAKLSGDAIPVLVASLKQDPSPAVRASVAESIGKLKPVTPSAGVVLEAAAVNDPSDTVRKAAQSALVAYQQAGYRPTSTAVAQTAEPPLAKPRPAMIASPARQIVAPPVAPAPAAPVPAGVNRGPTFTETAEPPLAKSKSPLPPVVVAPSVPVSPLPVPMAMPAAPKFPAPTPMPAKPTVPGTPIPTPPPSSDPGFEF